MMVGSCHECGYDDGTFFTIRLIRTQGYNSMTDHTEISIANSLEGRAVAQWAFGYFVHRRVSGLVSGGMAEVLALAVLREFMNSLENGVSPTPETKREAVDRAVDTFLADTEVPDGTQREALIDVVCTALNSAAMAIQPQPTPETIN